MRCPPGSWVVADTSSPSATWSPSPSLLSWPASFSCGIVRDGGTTRGGGPPDDGEPDSGPSSQDGHPEEDVAAALAAIVEPTALVFELDGTLVETVGTTDPEPLPGAVALLTALTLSRFPWAIATSTHSRQAAAAIDSLGLPGRPAIVDANQVERAKPAPDVLLAAAERLGSPAYRTWCIGSTTWDMQAARAAGMPGIGITSGAASADVMLAAGARVALPNLHELHEELVRRELVAGGR
jgi:hypothetical protein